VPKRENITHRFYPREFLLSAETSCIYDIVALSARNGEWRMIRLKVKEVAKSRGLSQSKLSRWADVDISTIRRLFREPGGTNITLETLNRLAGALGVDPCQLIEYTPDPWARSGEEKPGT
jgi:DNA-binding Xre family transcriptional regulator